MRLSILVTVLVTLGGCHEQTDCRTNADCPPQHHCFADDAGASGWCRQECQATSDCQEPGTRCSALGECLPWALPVADAAAEASVPRDGAVGDALAVGDGAVSDALADGALPDAGGGDTLLDGGIADGVVDANEAEGGGAPSVTRAWRGLRPLPPPDLPPPGSR